jgi:hypothetical protein
MTHRVKFQPALTALLEADLLVLDNLFLARRIGDKAGELLQALVQPALQTAAQHPGDLQPGGTGLGKVSGR